MSRQARKKSGLCMYHVILRGINKQIIFEDIYDYKYFISVLKYYKRKCKFKLYAYCIMNNHIHLLIEQTTIELEEIMKRIEVKFVRWYNLKYQRVGYLFQERYKSEPINDMEYFKVVFRYIHQNPLQAGVETTLGTYSWSSYKDYANLDFNFIDIDKVLNLFCNHEECMSYLNTLSNKKCMEYCSARMSDTDALKIIQLKTSCQSPSDFQRLELIVRNQYLQLLYNCGISIRQLSRLTGISRTAIQTAIHNV